MEQERKSYVNGFPLVLWSQKANGKGTLVTTLLIPISESCSAGENGFAMKLFFTWSLKSMYAAHELNFQLFVWHSWCGNMLTYLTYFTVGPRNQLHDTVGGQIFWHFRDMSIKSSCLHPVFQPPLTP